MPYQPSHAVLCELAAWLTETYIGKSAKRFSFIVLCAQLTKLTKQWDHGLDDETNNLMGSAAFLLTDIKYDEYHGKSPKRIEGRFWSTGSDLYTKTKIKLAITKEAKFGIEQRLYYLHQLDINIKKYYTDEHFKELQNAELLRLKKRKLHWTSKEKLLAQINKVIKLTMKNMSDILYSLVHGVPALSALLHNLQNMDGEYQSTSRNPNNPVRIEALFFVKFILQCYQTLHTDLFSWHTYSGVPLIVALAVKKEYRVFSPERSAMYRATMKALNQTKLEDIHIDDQIKWLQCLYAYLIAVTNNKKNYDSIIQEVVKSTQESKHKIDKENLEKLVSRYIDKISKCLEQLNTEKITPSTMYTVISQVTNYTVQHLAAPIAVQATKLIVIGGMAVGGYIMGGPIGSAVFGATGTVLISGLSRLVTEQRMNRVAAGIVGWLLERAGSAIGNATATVVIQIFSVTPQSMDELRKMLKPEDDVVFVQMINTLLERDELSVSDKQHVRNVLGLDEGQYLQHVVNEAECALTISPKN